MAESESTAGRAAAGKPAGGLATAEPADADAPAADVTSRRRSSRARCASTSRPGAGGSADGESGALPIIVGLVIIVIFFQLEQSSFLTAGNLVNLLVQAAVFIMFGAAEMFALMLSEIDLSVGYTAGVGAFVIAELIAPPVSLPWWLAIIGGLVATSFVGFIQGTLITRLEPALLRRHPGGLPRHGGGHARAGQRRQDRGRRRDLDRPRRARSTSS